MLKGNSGIIAVLVIISVILSFASPVFLTTDNLLSVLRQVSNNMYLALGMTLVIILGGIDLSVGTCVAMCGTLTAGLMVNQGMPMVLAIAVGLLLGTLAGFLNGLIIATFKVPCIYRDDVHDERGKGRGVHLLRRPFYPRFQRRVYRNRNRKAVRRPAAPGCVHDCTDYYFHCSLK